MIRVILYRLAFPPFQALGDSFESFKEETINVDDQLSCSTIKPAGYLIQMGLSIFKKCDFDLALRYIVQV